MVAHNLPTPDAIAKAHSAKLRDAIVREILKQGPMSFARFMKLALYAPGLGYYSAGARKFGEGGDFVTAPEISPLFSRCVARQCQQILTNVKQGDILEFGAGSGMMALEVLRELARQQRLPNYYYILEVSADLRERQLKLFREQAPEFVTKIKWLDSLPREKFKGIILANEVMDAMPVHRFKQSDDVQEIYVDFKQDKFQWHCNRPSRSDLTESVAALNVNFAEGYESEINLLLPAWIASLADILEQGVILLFDYGFPRHEYYHPDRSMGTLMCHYQHRAHSDPFLHVGLQDITAHVDFTTVAESAFANGLEIIGYTHQTGFLLGCGIETMLPNPEDIEEYYTIAQQVKRLTLPSEMGEFFKSMALAQNYNEELIGFSMMNQVEKL